VSHSHILIVEDSQSAATAIAKHLTRVGYAVTVINSLDQALHWLDTPGNLPDLLISDIQLARQNQHQLLRHVRTDPAALYPPVILMSPNEDISEKISSFAAGADDYLVKPVDPDELGLRARAVLTRTRAWRPAVIAALHR
jgi:two-component system phosphate regulon response regulator OmpR